MPNDTLSPDIMERVRNIKLLLMDCDGVLTDGRIYYTESGDELKAFHVRDGQGLVMWHEAGFLSGIISGRYSKLLERRARELGMQFLYQKSADKIEDFEKILMVAKVAPEETAFIGDDIPDIPLMKRVGLAIAVGDGCSETKKAAHYVTECNGGKGAVREVVNLILNSKGK